MLVDKSKVKPGDSGKRVRIVSEQHQCGQTSRNQLRSPCHSFVVLTHSVERITVILRIASGKPAIFSDYPPALSVIGRKRQGHDDTSHDSIEVAAMAIPLESRKA